MKTKQLAELQFDTKAKPISLGLSFESFSQYTINSYIDSDAEIDFDEEITLSDETEDIDCDPKSIVLIANDLDSIKREEFAQEVNTIQQSIESIQDDFENKTSISIQPIAKDDPLNIKSVDFQIKHSVFKKETIPHVIRSNKAVNAFRLVMLAIDKLEVDQKQRLQLIDQPKFRFDKILIDKSLSSVRFINEMGKRYEDFIFNKFPDRYKNLNREEDNDKILVDKIHVENNIDRFLAYSIIAKHIEFSHVEMNSFPGYDLGCTSKMKLVNCHQILHVLNFQTMHTDSPHYRNFERLVLNFPNLYNSDRLYYLEYLISRHRRYELFFNSDTVNFSEENDRWTNNSFPSINKWMNDWYRVVNQ